MPPTNAAEDVAGTIRAGILRGTFKPGTRLPSARDLAGQLRVNKNTVSKAYGMLAREGVIEVMAGRRATVAAGGHTRTGLDDFFRRQLRRVLPPVLREARLLGIAHERAVQVVLDEITRFYDAQARRVQFVECNKIDAQQYARDLGALLGCAVDWRLIEDITDPPDATEIFAVPYYHLQDVSDRLPGARLAAIHIAPDPEVLLQVLQAAQPIAGRVGLICGNANAVERFASLFRSYSANGIRITHYRDARSTAAAIAACRALFATAEAFSTVQELAGKKRVTEFTERIDAASLGTLRGLLLDASSDKMMTPRLARRPRTARGSRR